MAILRDSDPSFMTAEEAARRPGYAAQSELELRRLIEEFCRARRPRARVVHELVMGEGRTRADVVSIDERHIAAFEVKGAYDDTTRLIHQIGLFQLCVPEVWIVCAENHCDDARLVKHLLPSVGVLIGTGMDRNYHDRSNVAVTLRIEAEPTPFVPVPDMMLRILWRQEVFSAADRLRIARTSKSTRQSVVKSILEKCGSSEILEQVCFELRRRDALWRADPPASTGGASFKRGASA